MRYALSVLVIVLGLQAGSDADTIHATVRGSACVLCEVGLEKTFRAQPEVSSVDIDLDNNLVTVHTKPGRTIEDAKIRKLLSDGGYSVVRIAREKG